MHTITVLEAYQKSLHTIFGLLAIHLPEQPDGLYLIWDIQPTGDSYTLIYYGSNGEDFELEVPGSQILTLPQTQEQYLHQL